MISYQTFSILCWQEQKMKKVVILGFGTFLLLMACATTIGDVQRFEQEGSKSVSKLVKLLNSKDRLIRITAAQALGGIGDSTAVDSLISALRIHDNTLRKTITDALGYIGDPRAVEPLKVILDDKDGMIWMMENSDIDSVILEQETTVIPTTQDVNLAIIEAFKQIRSDSAINALISACDYSYSRTISMEASDALVTIGAPAVPQLITALDDPWNFYVWKDLQWIGEPAVQPLIAALKNERDSIRPLAAKLLPYYKDQRAIEPLIDALNDPVEDVQVEAASALGYLGGSQAIERLIGSLTNTSPQVREVSADALGRIQDKRAVPALISAVQDSNSQVRGSIIAALGKIGDPVAVPHIITALSDDNSTVRADAAFALSLIDDSRSTEPLIPVLKDDYWAARRFAIKALEKKASPDIIKLFVNMLDDSESSVREAAAEALTNIGEPAVGPVITKLMSCDVYNKSVPSEILVQIGDPAVEPLVKEIGCSERHLQKTIVGLLEKLEWQPTRDANGAWYWIVKGKFENCVDIGIPSLEPLTVALEGNDEDVREKAAKAIGNIGTPLAIAPLISALNYNDNSVRNAAVKALGATGQPGAIKPLIALLENDSRWLRSIAVESLDSLDYSPDHDVDGAWYCAVKGEYQKCAEIGVPAIEPLFTIWARNWQNNNKAKQTLDQIISADSSKAARSRLEELYLQRASDTNTLEGWNEFTSLYPDSKEGKKSLQKLKVQLAAVEEAVKKALPEGSRYEVSSKSLYPQKPEFVISTHLLEGTSADATDPNVRGDYGTHKKLREFVEFRCANIIRSIYKARLTLAASEITIHTRHGVRQKHFLVPNTTMNVAMTIFSVRLPLKLMNELDFSKLSDDEIAGCWDSHQE